ncbi:unnamed protein product, partial [Laminaria digitata]
PGEAFPRFFFNNTITPVIYYLLFILVVYACGALVPFDSWELPRRCATWLSVASRLSCASLFLFPEARRPLCTLNIDCIFILPIFFCVLVCAICVSMRATTLCDGSKSNTPKLGTPSAVFCV